MIQDYIYLLHNIITCCSTEKRNVVKQCDYVVDYGIYAADIACYILSVFEDHFV